MKAFKIAAVFLTVFPLFALAQSNYHAGYVIRNNGDTVKGYINYRDWSQSPKDIEFKVVLSDQRPTILNASTVKSFRIDGYGNYLKYEGPVSTGIVNTTNLPNHLDTAVRQDTVFMKVIVSGPNVTLLYHADDIKHRYFILENGSAKPWELNFYQYLNIDRIINYSPFASQLGNLLKKYGAGHEDMVKNLRDDQYYEDIFIQFVKIINKNQSTDVGRSSSVRLYVGGGVSYNTPKFTGPPGFGYNSTYTSVTPIIDGGVDFLSSADIQNSFLRIETSLYSYSPAFNGTVANFTSTQLVFTISPQLIFNLYNTDKLKYFVGLGVGASFAAISNSKLTATQGGVIFSSVGIQNKGESLQSLQVGQTISNPYDIGNISASLIIKTGFVLNKKTELYLSAKPIFLGASAAYYSYKNLSAIVGFNYLLGSSKNN